MLLLDSDIIKCLRDELGLLSTYHNIYYLIWTSMTISHVP